LKERKKEEKKSFLKVLKGYLITKIKIILQHVERLKGYVNKKKVI